MRHRRPNPTATETLEAYCQLLAWRLEHPPWLTRAEGQAVLLRLMNAKGGPLYTTDFYRSAGRSAPKVLSVLRELERSRLITIVSDANDHRRMRVQATDRLIVLARSYVTTMLTLLGDSRRR